MSNHVSEWLNAYLDGELPRSRLHYVQTHLAECDACLAELDSLENLSVLLHQVPAPEFTLAERFAAQVNLRLPPQKATTSRKKILEVGWWMIPVGLLAIWIAINTSFFVYDMLSVANSFGLLTNVSDWMRLVTSNFAGWSSVLGEIGILRGNSLNLVTSTEAFTRTSWIQITLQVSIALLYLSWIVLWWARNTRYQHQQRGQPVQG